MPYEGKLYVLRRRDDGRFVGREGYFVRDLKEAKTWQSAKDAGKARHKLPTARELYVVDIDLIMNAGVVDLREREGRA